MVTPMITNINIIAEAIFTGFSILLAKASNLLFINMPIPTGMMTITNNCFIMVMASTVMAILSLENSSNANCTMKGMVKMEIILDTAVRETDKAKSPLAK